jgi:hypothetical protein
MDNRSIPESASALPRHGSSAAVDQPLGLTVHSLPNPATVMEGGGDGKRTATGRWKMILVLLICAAPVIASYFTYYVVRPEGRRNFGELIDPQRPLPDINARTLEGKAVNLRALKGQWLLVSVGSGGCNEACAHNLYLQRQLHTSLGKDKDRVERVWMIADEKPSDEKPVESALRTAITDAVILRLGTAQLSSWLTAADGQRLADHLYLVDPMGNWMMRFPAKLDLAAAAKAKKDIERLLRASASWDNAGR